MDLTKLLLLALAVVLVGIAIGLALAWAAPLTDLGVAGLSAMTDELGAEGWGGWVAYPVQAYEVASFAFSPVPGLWNAVLTFGSLMAVYFVWQVIVTIYGKLFS